MQGSGKKEQNKDKRLIWLFWEIILVRCRKEPEYSMLRQITELACQKKRISAETLMV